MVWHSVDNIKDVDETKRNNMRKFSKLNKIKNLLMYKKNFWKNRTVL